MDFCLLLLFLIIFVVGLVESILIGILLFLVEDLWVFISLVGQFIILFFFGFVFVVLLFGWLIWCIECCCLLLVILLLFVFSNVFVVFVLGYFGLFLVCLGMLVCCGLLIVFVSLFVVELVVLVQCGWVIGLIFMGISGLLVFGVLLGVQISDWFGWCWIFVGIVVYLLFLCLLFWCYLL